MSKLILATIGLSILLTGCQTVPYEGQAHDVKKKPQTEGTVAVPVNYRNEDRAKADERMKANCSPYPVSVLEEGEVVVGQEVKATSREDGRDSSQTKIGSLFGIPVTSGQPGGKDVQSSSVTTAVKEWQISYKCEKKAEAKR